MNNSFERIKTNTYYETDIVYKDQRSHRDQENKHFNLEE